MSKFDAMTILDNVKARRGTPKFPEKTWHKTLNEEDMNAAIALCEMANGLRPPLENGQNIPTSDFASSYDKKGETKLGNRKFLEDGSTSRSRRKVEHHNTDDHDDCGVRDLYNKAVCHGLDSFKHSCGT